MVVVLDIASRKRRAYNTRRVLPLSVVLFPVKSSEAVIMSCFDVAAVFLRIVGVADVSQ